MDLHYKISRLAKATAWATRGRARLQLGRDVIGGGNDLELGVMWVKQCHKPPMWECFIPPVYGDLGDGLLLFYPHYS